MPVNTLTAGNLAVGSVSFDTPPFNPPVILGDYALDYGLRAFPTKCNRIYVCNGPLTDYNSVLAAAVGFKDFGGGFGFGGITNGAPNGRVVTSLPFNNGMITASGTAVTWAAVDTVDQQLLAWGTLASNIVVSQGQLFALPSFVIHEYTWFAGANINIPLDARFITSQVAFLGRPVESLVVRPALPIATATVVFTTPTAIPGNVLDAFDFRPIRTNVIETPPMVQKHKLTATNLASKAASLGSSGISFLGQYADGFTGAPAGTPQFPTMLNTYGVNRPPWNVAGVDYYVGVIPGITMRDASVQANLPTGVVANATTKQVIIKTANVTLGTPTSGFNLPTDWQIYITTGASGTITIQNCKITIVTTLQGIYNDAATPNIVLLNNEINGSSVNTIGSPSLAGGISINGTTGSFTARYNYIHHVPTDFMDIGAGTFDIRYNLCYATGSAPGDNGGHPDTIQQVGFTTTNAIFAFNTTIWPTNYVDPGGQNNCLDIEAQLGAAMTNEIYANNTVIAQGTPGGTSGTTTPCLLMCGSFITDTSSTLKGFQFIHNFIDPSGSTWGLYGVPATQLMGTAGYPLVYLGNYCMKAFNDGQGDVFPLGPANPNQVGRVPVGSITATLGPSDSDVWTTTANPSSGTLSTGNNVDITVTYVRKVNASGASLSLNNGATAIYVSGTGTTALLFRYTVASGDASVTNLKVNAVNGAISDEFGNAMVETNALVTFTGLNVGGGAVGNVPVITPASFTLNDPITLDELVGNITATNTPTSWAITGGNSSNYFRIYLQGNGSANLRTNDTGATPPNGTYSLTVTATNAAGTSSPATITVHIQAAGVSPPVVTGNSFTLYDPITNGETVGTVTATNSPTSFAITAGNSAGYFVISNGGIITVRASGAVPPDATYNLSVTATNSGGTSNPATVAVTIQPVSSGGSYDNLNTWPSVANRPVYNSSNNSLSWYGPTAGGPSTSSDVRITQTLTNSGAVTTTSAGQTIQNLHITGGNPSIEIKHSNVTVKRCYIQASGGSDVYNIIVNQGLTGILIEDCEINHNGTINDSGSFNIISTGGILGNVTVRRCHLHNAEQMVARTMQNVTIIDNYMHDVKGVDADMVEIYCDSGPTHDVIIRHNTFEEPAVNSSFNSAINMSNWTNAGGVIRITIDANRFLCPDNPHVFCDDNRQGSGPVTYSATNNGFINTIVQVQTGDNNGVSPNSGNYVLTTTNDTVHSGTPFNGTGAV